MAIQSIHRDTARTDLAEKRLAAAYSRLSGAEVPVVAITVPTLPYTYSEKYHDLDKMLEHSVDLAAKMASLDHDWPPFIDTLCSVPMVAEAFGCKMVWAANDMPWAGHLIYDISKVWELKPMRPADVPSIRRNAEWVDYAQRTLGTELPVWMLDIQSPFSVAAQIVSPEELMVACFTEPRAVHHICQMVTDYTIGMMQEHIRQVEHPCFPGRNFPSISQQIGICLSDDTPLIMLSPQAYREFALPYNSQIGKAFGGVHLHSCGDYSHNLDNVLDIANIKSIQVHAGPGEFHLPEKACEDHPFNLARKRVTYFIDSNDVTRGDLYRNRPRNHYAEYVLPRLLQADMTGCILQSCGSTELGMQDVNAAIGWTRSQLNQT